MEESVKTMKLNNRMYYVLAEMVHKNTKYYYLVNDDASELQKVKEVKDNLDIVIESVRDKEELHEVFELFNDKIAIE